MWKDTRPRPKLSLRSMPFHLSPHSFTYWAHTLCRFPSIRTIPVPSVRHNHPLRIAFLGEMGGYSEEAAFHFFGSQLTPVRCFSFAEVVEKTETHEADAAVIPVENCIAGTVMDAWEVLL